jgi:uncharacterized coiled-coil protein SlyX
MSDAKKLIDGLFTSMFGDERDDQAENCYPPNVCSPPNLCKGHSGVVAREPEADQLETAECPACEEVFLAGTASERGWCEDCETPIYPERQEPSDTVGAPILNASPRYYNQGDEEEPEGSQVDKWCADEKCCNPPGYHLHGAPDCPDCGASDAHMPGPTRESVRCSKCEHIYEPQPREDDEETDPARNLDHSTLETLVACQWDEIDTLTEKVASLDTKVYELERRLEAWTETLHHLGIKQRATIQLIKGIRDLLHEAL